MRVLNALAFTTIEIVDEKPRIRRSMAVFYAQSHEYSTRIKSCRSVVQSSSISGSQPLSPTLSLKTTLSLTAFKDDLFMSYLFSKMFGREYGYSLDSAGETRCGFPADWISELVRTPQKPGQKSWDALAAIIFGQAHNDSFVITTAFTLYGQAPSELRIQLQDPDVRRTDSTLASITALYVYEVSQKRIA
jgi:hypothetical protein